jgi:hypothetical protein
MRWRHIVRKCGAYDCSVGIAICQLEIATLDTTVIVVASPILSIACHATVHATSSTGGVAKVHVRAL